MVAFIGKNELRLVNSGSWKFILCSRAPKWDVIVYRPDDKTMFKQSYDNFLKRGFVSDMVFPLWPRNACDSKLCKPKVTNGVPVLNFANRFHAITYVQPNQINPKISAITYLVYKTPTNGGFPLRYVTAVEGRDFFSGIDDTGKVEAMISTSEIKKSSVPSDYFECPANLKQMPCMEDVVLAKGSRSESDAVFKELMHNR